MKLNLWLGDLQRAPTFIESGLVWATARTGDEAIEMLRSGDVEFASLEYDISGGCHEKTGWDVMTWMTENSVWPKNGVRIHALNYAWSEVMISLVKRVYGRTFQYSYGEPATDSLSKRRVEDWAEEEDGVSTNTYS